MKQNQILLFKGDQDRLSKSFACEVPRAARVLARVDTTKTIEVLPWLAASARLNGGAGPLVSRQHINEAIPKPGPPVGMWRVIGLCRFIFNAYTFSHDLSNETIFIHPSASLPTLSNAWWRKQYIFLRIFEMQKNALWLIQTGTCSITKKSSSCHHRTHAYLLVRTARPIWQAR